MVLTRIHNAIFSVFPSFFLPLETNVLTVPYYVYHAKFTLQGFSDNNPSLASQWTPQK